MELGSLENISYTQDTVYQMTVLKNVCIVKGKLSQGNLVEEDTGQHTQYDKFVLKRYLYKTIR